MKITNQQLKKIIKEELELLLIESFYNDGNIMKLVKLFLSGDLGTIKQAASIAESMDYVSNYYEETEHGYGFHQTTLTVEFTDRDFYNFLKRQYDQARFSGNEQPSFYEVGYGFDIRGTQMIMTVGKTMDDI